MEAVFRRKNRRRLTNTIMTTLTATCAFAVVAASNMTNRPAATGNDLLSFMTLTFLLV